MPSALLKWLGESEIGPGSRAVIVVEPTKDGRFTWYMLDIDPQMIVRVKKVANGNILR